MRCFRDFLKQKFMDAYGSKYYYWVPSTLRQKTKEFFCTKEQGYRFDNETYTVNEFVLIRLIHNSKKGEETSSMPGIEEQHKQLLKEVFGSKPNTKNLREFFRINIIQELWWGYNGFVSSDAYQKILSDPEHPEKAFNHKEREVFLKYFQKACPPGRSFS